MTEKHLRIVEQLDGVARELRTSLSNLAIAWILRHQSVASALVGATKLEQLDENAKASEVVLTPDVVQMLENILGTL